MNAKKYLIAVIVVFVVYSAVAFVVHNVVLKPDYEALQVTREFRQLVQRTPLIYLANLIFSLAFCYIYVKGYEPGKNWVGQGLRFGLLVATLLAPVALIGYVALPVSWILTVKVVAFSYLQVLIAALFAASIYQTPPPVKTL